MSTASQLLDIETLDLTFPFELNKQISCSLELTNKTNIYVAFKVKTTNPKKYCVRPNAGIILPRSTADVTVTMQAQKEAPPDLQCKDKFLLQSVKAPYGATPKDISAEMFNKDAGNVVEESKLRVIYVSPPQPSSPVREGSEEGSSPRASFSDIGSGNGSQFPIASSSSEKKTLILKLTEEKNNAIQQSNKLRQELAILKRGGHQPRNGVSYMFVIVVGLLGMILGYLMKKS